MVRRRRKKKYKSGIYTSKKNNGTIIKYRSGWEHSVIQFLEASADVVSYSYETVILPYVSNLRTGKIRKYFVDFLVVYASGERKLIEVKRRDKVSELKTMKKLKAGEEYAMLNKIGWEIWDEKKIAEINKILGIVPLKLKKKKRSGKSLKPNSKTTK